MRRYMSSEGTPDDGQRSGAYIFRPNVTFSNGSAFNLKVGENHVSFYNDGPFLKSVHTKYGDPGALLLLRCCRLVFALCDALRQISRA